MSQEQRTTSKYENQWIPNKENTSWTLIFWPFHLVIDFKPREPKPFLGSLEAKGFTLGELRSWATIQEAAVGMIEWGCQELSQAYHELAKLLPPGAGK